MGSIPRQFLAIVATAFLLVSQSNAASIHEQGFQVQNDSRLEIFDALQSGFLGKGVDSGFEERLLTSLVIPQYIQTLLKVLAQDPDPIIIVEKLFNGIEGDCKAHSFEWIYRALNDKLALTQEADKWVLHMFDAWGKIPEGILTGHVNSFGDFDECMQIEVADWPFNDTFPVTSKHFEGRYCTVYAADYTTAMGLTMEPITKLPASRKKIGERLAVSLEEMLQLMAEREGILITPSLGVCFPNSCSYLQIQQILVNAVDLLYRREGMEASPLYPQNLTWPANLACYDSKKPDLDAADYSVIALIGGILALCLGAGIIDYWLNHGVDKPPRRGAAYQYFMAFSLYTNIRKWLSTRKSADDLGCLHGIRFLSTAWVVLAHTYYVITFLPSWNMIDVKRVYEDWSVLTVINATFAVDTFFVLSGMLVCYNVMKMLDKTKGKINIPMLYIHRYLRLTPTYAILVGIMATLVPYFGNGPYWAVMTRWGNICENNWWTNLLYVNNFVNTSWMCQGEAWYLANDMQFYVLSPFIIYPMWRWEMIGMILLAVWTILSCVSPMLLVHYLDTTPTTLPTRDIGKWYTHIYIRPYARIQTFLIGVWLGWILHKTRGKKVNLPWIVVVGGWLLTSAVCPFLLYSIQPWFDPEYDIPDVSALAYAGLSRAGWGMAMGWVIFACIKGYGGVINSFLSWSVFMPLGRLCYCVYLVSLHLQMILHVRFTQPMRFDAYTQLNFFFGHMIMSFLVGFFCTLLFESPFMILQKLIFEGTGPPRPPQNNAAAKRPSKRYGIFYNNATDTVINAQELEAKEKVSQD